jgi:hypothetical protein
MTLVLMSVLNMTTLGPDVCDKGVMYVSVIQEGQAYRHTGTTAG